MADAPSITVGEAPDPSLLIEGLDEVRRKEWERETRRREFAREIAKQRWQIAQYVHRLEDGVSKLNFKTHPFQKAIYQDDSLDLVITGSTQWGKPLRKGTRIRTALGLIPIEFLLVGTMVLTPSGQYAKVLGVYPQGVIPLYRVSFADGRSVDAGGGHLWEVHSSAWDEPRVISTRYILQLLHQGIPMRVPEAAEATHIDTRIARIDPCGEDEAFCIAVDHPSHLFVTENYTATHNTEFLIVDMAASAASGLKVLVVISKHEKKNKFVLGRLDPCFGSVPVYKQFIEAAANRNANADSTQLKHFGPGSINLIGSLSAKDFTSYPADKCLVDEHQECNLENIGKLGGRMSGSWFGGFVRVGHPSTAGTESNENLDWLYQNSDQRQWMVPCPTCHKPQLLNWWQHVVYEERHKGGILSVRPRDAEWDPKGKWDIRPICDECRRPMDRLHDEGFWEARFPEVERHGYQLSNLYNANVRLRDLLSQYNTARHSGHAMQEFVNKQLGMPYDFDGSKITEAMLVNCASGDGTKIAPYRFITANNFQWKKEHAR